MRFMLTLLLLAGINQAQAQQPTWQEIKAKQDRQVAEATLLFNQHKPLPALPSLDRRVFVKVGAWACNTAGELLNPHRAELLVMGECVQASRRISVRVMPPNNLEDYILSYVKNEVLVIWSSDKAGDASIYTAWVDPRDLTN